MAEFNNNPSEFVDFNDLFPVLNEKVGLTYEQWRKAIENINFVKANLGVSDVERGEVNISVVEDDAEVGLDITTREGVIEKNGVQRTVIYIDFDLKVPSGKVKSVNGQAGAVELTADDVGAVGKKNYTLSSEQTITNGADGILIKTQGTLAGATNASSSMTAVGGRISFETNDEVTINGERVAVESDLAGAAGGIEHLVGTEEKPINMATDMEVGKLYGASGKIYLGNLDFPITITGNLIFYKAEASKVGVFNCYGNVNQLFYSPGTYTEYKITSSGDAAGVVGSYRTFSSIDTLNGSRSSNGAYIYAPNSGGTPGQILKSNGSGAAPTWIDLPTGGIEELVGTEDAPINFATDMEVGHLYSVSGTVTLSKTITVNVVDNVLIFKYSETWIQVLNGYATNGLLAAQTGVFSDVRINNSTGYIGTTNLYTTLDKLNGSEYLQPREIYAPLNSGEAGQVLQSNGTNSAPTWVDMPESGITTLVGTSDKYINFYNDMEAGKYYIISGYIYSIAGNTDYISLPVLAYRYSDDKVRLFNSAIIANQYGSYKWKSSPKQDTLVAIYSSGINGLIGNINLINTLNGSNENEPIDIYAPTSSGSAGQILQSNGSGAPIWVDMPSGGGIETIVGTEDKPINVASDLQSGNLYLLSGHIVLSSTVTDEVASPILTLKSSNSNIVFYGAYRFGSYLAPRPYSTSVCSIGSDGSINVLHQAMGIASLNGTANFYSPPAIFAPTTGGTSGQILQSTGSSTPKWVTPNYATIDDITNAIGNVSTLLGDTDDLEV